MSGAVDLAERSTATITKIAPLLLRLTAGMLWLTNIGWKSPPDFGEHDGVCNRLCGFVQDGIDHPVAPGYSWLLEEIVRPNLRPFGWGVVIVEFLLAAFLLSGTLTRLTAAIGFVMSIVIGLTVANAPAEWYWSYALMASLQLAVFALAAGRTFGVDSILRANRPAGSRWLKVLT
jgi:thiosulfate dehydrogenase [quinone] large subunit